MQHYSHPVRCAGKAQVTACSASTITTFNYFINCDNSLIDDFGKFCWRSMSILFQVKVEIIAVNTDTMRGGGQSN